MHTCMHECTHTHNYERQNCNAIRKLKKKKKVLRVQRLKISYKGVGKSFID